MKKYNATLNDFEIKIIEKSCPGVNLKFEEDTAGNHLNSVVSTKISTLTNFGSRIRSFRSCTFDIENVCWTKASIESLVEDINNSIKKKVK